MTTKPNYAELSSSDESFDWSSDSSPKTKRKNLRKCNDAKKKAQLFYVLFTFWFLIAKTSDTTKSRNATGKKKNSPGRHLNCFVSDTNLMYC